MVRGSDGVISLTCVNLGRSYKGQLLKNKVSVRDSAIVTMEHVWELMVRGSDGVISLKFVDL